MVKRRIIGAALVAAAGSATFAQEADWQVQCYGADPTRSCEAAYSVMMPGQDAPLAQMALGWMAKDAPMLLTVVVPPDVSLATALTLSGPDGVLLTLPWARCRPGGCFAVAEATDTQITTLTAAESALMAYTDGTEAALTLRVPLTGLDTAAQALAKARAE